MGICTTTTDMSGMGSRHGQPGMRNETVAAALAAAASLVIRRTSDQIKIAEPLYVLVGGAQKTVPL